jgi:hypothetical protein
MDNFSLEKTDNPEIYKSLPTSIEVNSAWSFASTTPYIVMAWCSSDEYFYLQ